MDPVLAAAVRTPYKARPGRSVLVVNELSHEENRSARVSIETMFD
jgi:hypothetical protein